PARIPTRQARAASRAAPCGYGRTRRSGRRSEPAPAEPGGPPDRFQRSCSDNVTERPLRNGRRGPLSALATATPPAEERPGQHQRACDDGRQDEQHPEVDLAGDRPATQTAARPVPDAGQHDRAQPERRTSRRTWIAREFPPPLRRPPGRYRTLASMTGPNQSVEPAAAGSDRRRRVTAALGRTAKIASVESSQAETHAGSATRCRGARARTSAGEWPADGQTAKPSFRSSTCAQRGKRTSAAATQRSPTAPLVLATSAGAVQLQAGFHTRSASAAASMRTSGARATARKRSRLKRRPGSVT